MSPNWPHTPNYQVMKQRSNNIAFSLNRPAYQPDFFESLCRPSIFQLAENDNVTRTQITQVQQLLSCSLKS